MYNKFSNNYILETYVCIWKKNALYKAANYVTKINCSLFPTREGRVALATTAY